MEKLNTLFPAALASRRRDKGGNLYPSPLNVQPTGRLRFVEVLCSDRGSEMPNKLFPDKDLEPPCFGQTSHVSSCLILARPSLLPAFPFVLSRTTRVSLLRARRPAFSMQAPSCRPCSPTCFPEAHRAEVQGAAIERVRSLPLRRRRWSLCLATKNSMVVSARLGPRAGRRRQEGGSAWFPAPGWSPVVHVTCSTKHSLLRRLELEAVLERRSPRRAQQPSVCSARVNFVPLLSFSAQAALRSNLIPCRFARKPRA